MKKIIQLIDKYLVFGLVVLYPLFFLPSFVNPFETGKLLILVVLVLLISTIKIAKLFLQNNLTFKFSKVDLLVLGLTLTYVVSTIFVTPGKMDALLLPGTTSFIVGGALLYFFVNQFTKENKQQLNIFLAISTFVFSLVHLLSFTGVLQANFNTFGNEINSFFFLTAMFVIFLVQVLKEGNVKLKIFFGITSFITFVALSTVFYTLLPTKNTRLNLPSTKTSWSVAIDSLKQSPIFGVGPGNFMYSYSKFRPLTNNEEENWNVKYLVGSNSLFTIMTEVGLLGIILFIFIFILSFINQKENNNYKFSVLLIFILSLLYPFSPSFLPILFILIALNNNPKEVGGIFNSRVPLVLILLPFLGLVVASAYFSYIGFKGEYIFTNGLKFVAKNEAINAYENVNRAVLTNQYVDRYHLAAAEINIAIAESISKKENLTDEDKKTISDLIQQSISEGKAAIALNRFKSSLWQNLGNIYISISPFAENASGFAVESYNQAIFLDPTDPNLRIKLGGILYASEKYDEAIKVFELAVLAKPDFANSHYNLAIAYKADKQIDKAKEQIEIVLKLVDPSSNDYEVAKKELDSLNEAKATDETAEETEQTETLTPPAEAVEELEPQVELPTETPTPPQV